jgi:O-antigen/teichoic acid export membrane protein
MTRVVGQIATLLRGGGLRGKIATLAGGTAFAQLLAVAISPVLSRLYGPAEFGVLVALASTSSLLAILANLRLSVAIPLPREWRKARELLGLSLILTTVCALCVLVLAWIFAEPFFAWLDVPEAASFWWYLPVATAAMAGYDSLYYWALRLQQYQRLMRTRIWQSVSNALGSVGIGAVHPGPLGLVVGGILSQGAGMGSLLLNALKKTPDATGTSPGSGWTAIRTAREHAAFAVLGCPAALFNAAGLMLPPVILIGLYGPEAGGAFSFAFKIVSMPMALVGAAVAQVFLAEASPLLEQNPAMVRHLFRRFILRLLPFSMALIVGGSFCPLLFPPVFGPDWALAGWHAAFLAVSCASQLIVSPVSNIAVMTRRQGGQLMLDALRTAVMFVSLWGSWRLGATAIQAVMYYAASMTLLYGGYFVFYYRAAQSVGGARS